MTGNSSIVIKNAILLDEETLEPIEREQVLNNQMRNNQVPVKRTRCCNTCCKSVYAYIFGFDSATLFICILNVIVFMVVLLLFFWFILSRQFEITIVSKVDIIVLLAKEDKNVYNQILEYIDLNYEQVKNQSIYNEHERDVFNWELLKNKIGPMIYIFMGLFKIVIIYIIIKKKRFIFVDYLLVFFVLACFLPELLFYYILLENWTFIGDQVIYQNMLGL